MKKLILSALQTFLIGTVVLGILLFLPAGTLSYWQAWVFIVVFMVCVNAVGIYLSIHDPELLVRRKKVGPAAETSPVQKAVMSIGLFGVLAILVVSALDHRFGWSTVSPLLSVIGDGLVALGLFMNVLVFKENSFGGSTVETFADQKVISTGPYAIVRHPMYAGVLVMLVGIPLALGSLWGLLVLAIISPGLIWRIIDEEKLLNNDLPGYSQYMHKVCYRLVPYLW